MPRTGRPRTHPPGTTATQRRALCRRALAASGGRRITVDLPAEAARALDALTATGESVAGAVARAIIRLATPPSGKKRPDKSVY